jgi:hypothetical protein
MNGWAAANKGQFAAVGVFSGKPRKVCASQRIFFEPLDGLNTLGGDF